MTKAEKVVWTEGMFLRPHHFQRTESYLLNHVREWGALQRSYLWGFLDVELDEAMLRQGCIALSYCSGLAAGRHLFPGAQRAQRSCTAENS
jgi:type VI secretion system protein ImpJ